MPDKKLYLLAVFDDDTQIKLAGYYDLLTQNGFVGSQTKNIPYHFTLGSRCVDGEEALTQALDSVCRETARIEINLAHIGLFGSQVLFIAPNMNFELLQLQNRFFSGGCRGCHDWSAHATLLIDEPSAIHKALPVITASFQPFKARIDSVALYEFFPARFIKTSRLEYLS